MTNKKLLCRTIETELMDLSRLLKENNIISYCDIKVPSVNTCYSRKATELTCIYDVFVEPSDLERASDLLTSYGQPVWMWKQ